MITKAADGQASIRITLPAPTDIYRIHFRGAWNKGVAKVCDVPAQSWERERHAVPHDYVTPYILNSAVGSSNSHKAFMMYMCNVAVCSKRPCSTIITRLSLSLHSVDVALIINGP